MLLDEELIILPNPLLIGGRIKKEENSGHVRFLIKGSFPVDFCYFAILI